MTIRNRYSTLAVRALVVSSLVTGCERRDQVEVVTCDLNMTRITDSMIGPLHINEPLPSLRIRCPTVSDTTVALSGSAGMMPALRLMVAGAPVIIRHDGNQVTALRVESPFFRTTDSLGVGTSVAKFADLRGFRVSEAGRAPYGVLVDRIRCGVSYELSGWGSTLPLASDDRRQHGVALTGWPDLIVVRAVTVSRCGGIPGDLVMDSTLEPLADSAPPVMDSMIAPPPIPVPIPIPLPPPVSAPAARTSKPDTGSIFATPRELADLNGKLDVPVQGVTRAQLRDTYAEPRGGRVHEALDILAPRGTPVVSAIDGRVLRLFDSKAGGLMVYATDPSERFILLYGHLDRYAPGLGNGSRLERGQVIGYVGTTGNAPIGTPHLHFAILRGRPNVAWSAGTPVNPYSLLVPGRQEP